jgi:hypothetical protein
MKGQFRKLEFERYIDSQTFDCKSRITVYQRKHPDSVTKEQRDEHCRTGNMSLMYDVFTFDVKEDDINLCETMQYFYSVETEILKKSIRCDEQFNSFAKEVHGL